MASRKPVEAPYSIFMEGPATHVAKRTLDTLMGFKSAHQIRRLDIPFSARESKLDYQRAYYAANKDKAADYYQANRAKIKAQRVARGVARASERSAAYRAKKFGAPIATDPAEMTQIVALYQEAHDRSHETGSLHHVDHRLPLKLGGCHCLDNLQVLNAFEHMQKSYRENATIPVSNSLQV